MGVTLAANWMYHSTTEEALMQWQFAAVRSLLCLFLTCAKCSFLEGEGTPLEGVTYSWQHDELQIITFWHLKEIFSDFGYLHGGHIDEGFTPHSLLIPSMQEGTSFGEVHSFSQLEEVHPSRKDAFGVIFAILIFIYTLLFERH